MLKQIIYIFIAYALAAPLTEHIFMDLTLTHWTNIWTYVFWGLSLLIWKGIAWTAVFLTALAVAVYSEVKG